MPLAIVLSGERGRMAIYGCCRAVIDHTLSFARSDDGGPPTFLHVECAIVAHGHQRVLVALDEALRVIAGEATDAAPLPASRGEAGSHSSLAS